MASCDRQTGDRPSSRQSDAKESIELIHTKATEDDAPIDLSDRGDEDLTPQPVVEEAQDPNLVTWDGPNDVGNPKNWASRERWTICVLVSLFHVAGPLSSAIIAPGLAVMGQDLNTSDVTIEAMILSIYMLAFSFGPMITSPLSEMYGRVPVLQGCNTFFLIFNTACGFATTPGQMLALRLLTGVGGCAAQSIGGAIMGELFTPLERAKAVSIYSIALFIGPVIGPLCGGAITQYASWRWSFWVISIFDILVQLCGLFLVKETYAPVLLRRKRNALVTATGNQELYTEFDGKLNWDALLAKNMKRPFEMLFSQPIVQFMSIYMGYSYGLAFMLSAIMPMVFGGVYGQSPAVVSLNYLPSSIGVIVLSQIVPRLANMLYKRLTARQPDQKALPEFRIPLLFPATVLALTGLLWFGWSAQHQLPVAMPNIGAVLLTAGTYVTNFCINQYLIDTYTVHAASALGAATIFQGVFGFVIPFVAPRMVSGLGLGVGMSVLAGVVLLVGMPGAVVVWKWGARLREKSLLARK